MQTTIKIQLPGSMSVSDQHALNLLLADALRAFIASRSGDYVARRYENQGHPPSFLQTKQALTFQRLRMAERLLENIWETTVDVQNDVCEDEGKQYAWISIHGSEKLRLALASGSIENVQDQYNEERLARDIGPTWLPLSKIRPGLMGKEVSNPSESQLQELVQLQQQFPACHPRLRLTRPAIGSSNDPSNDWRVTLLMEVPWNDNVTVIRYLTDPGE